jgi:hypothetical protein
VQDNNALEKFKRFVSEILTVKKEDIDRAESARKAEIRARPPAPKDDDDEDYE